MREKGVGTGSLPTDKSPEKAAEENTEPEEKAKPKATKTASLAKAAAEDKPFPDELF